MAETESSAHTARSALMTNRANSTSVLSPKGILKNKIGPQESRSPHLTWDEPNLALNDLNRDSTMKITEPKTPFVRYNAETDEVMDLESIPDFDLGRASSSSSSSHQASAIHEEPMATDEDQSQNPSSSMRRFSSSSSRRGSGSTERRQVLVQPPVGPSSTAGDDALDDEEDGADLDPDARAKHDAFLRARKGHYGNEAEAMKKARELAEKEEIESEATVESTAESDQLSDSSNSEVVPAVPNGV
ncbi:hypothetical protein PTTG_08934 [Puccinia triticina 1-1 BBBD Race 1]|uniref:Protein phosphatase inhibitor 2 (IPP-2) n=2 Tax=Puccinia triticina TaxID=208348 RepID=A0A0C4F707_PUCT1|nr:uncharacterized protein PtA15_6A350 [Puccinia triticina]OAV96907.1 hypothetical protein PTTG_08934 [Puccinia triticina 1-1 BBBD Race 1]WAQ85721.1 hypothetical protein PtA15_6A350 [Puccinia triticina]WAR55596.1 hypothetical protein PtB15_6B339 [Puccinia triticina]